MMDGSSRLWAIGIGILAAVIALALAAAPATAPQHWHLLTAPLILAAYRFGKRGAIAVSGLCVVVGLWVFRAAGNAVLDPAQLSERLGGAALSPDQLSALALQLADLRQETPLLAFVRVLTGLGVAIAASIALGASVDRRERSMRLQERAVDQLRRHFSPQVVETILAQPSDGGPYATSSRKEVT
ncbi:MAG: hypothetical protein NTZ05_00700, partial [Chloroflexi bacterium]|nr:hypothetical protein [Chloroflexota bacterium]